MYDLKGYVAQLKKLLKPGGLLIIAVPNYQSYDARKYRQSWAAYDLPRHLYHFSPASMQRLVSQFQLKIIGLKPMWFDSYYVSMLSEKYKHGRNGYLAAFLTASISNLKALFNTNKCSSIIYLIKNNP